MTLHQQLAAKKADDPPACYTGGTRSGGAFVEFRPDAQKRVGFPWAQLCHYTLEPHRGDAAEALDVTGRSAVVGSAVFGPK